MELQRELDMELRLLRDRVFFLGAEAEQALDRGRLAFANRDIELAYSVLAHDEAIDEIEGYVDQQCLRILALTWPEARDLRFALCIVKIAPLLERIADQACHIARITVELKDEPLHPIVSGIDEMSNHALSMLRSGLGAVSSRDLTGARRVIEKDREMDRLYNHSMYSLLSLIVSEPMIATYHTKQLLVAQHIRRIGNYVADICELTA